MIRTDSVWTLHSNDKSISLDYRFSNWNIDFQFIDHPSIVCTPHTKHICIDSDLVCARLKWVVVRIDKLKSYCITLFHIRRIRSTFGLISTVLELILFLFCVKRKHSFNEGKDLSLSYIWKQLRMILANLIVINAHE